MSEMADAFWASVTRPCCSGCGNKEWTSMRSIVVQGQMLDQCDRCGDYATSTVQDVFFNRPYYSEALGVEFTSKAQKAAYLKANGLSEAGDIKFKGQDWITGTREVRRKEFEKQRPIIRRGLQRWKETGYARER